MVMEVLGVEGKGLEVLSVETFADVLGAATLQSESLGVERLELGTLGVEMLGAERLELGALGIEMLGAEVLDVQAWDVEALVEALLSDLPKMWLEYEGVQHPEGPYMRILP